MTVSRLRSRSGRAGATTDVDINGTWCATMRASLVPGDAQAHEVVFAVSGEAVRGAQPPGIGGPGAATYDPAGIAAAPRPPSAPVLWGALVAIMVAVRRPRPDVPRGVIQSEAVRGEASDRGRALVIVVAPEIGGLAAGPVRILVLPRLAGGTAGGTSWRARPRRPGHPQRRHRPPDDRPAGP